jgi:transposase
MISRELVFEIHRLKKAGYKERKIARLLGVGRNTIKRYLLSPDRVFKSGAPRASKLDNFKSDIQEYLQKDPSVGAPVVLRLIQDKGYTGKITILREYLHAQRGQVKSKRAYIRIESAPGEQCQVDWGSFGSIAYGDTKRKLYALAIVESYSRMLYVEFTHSQKQQVLHSCLLNAFKYFGGVPQELVVDNMVTAVTDRAGQVIRFNDAFLDFLRPLNILPRACNVRSPFEKGKIENSIKYIRRNFMPLREYDDLTDIQAQVLDWLNQVANVRDHQTTGEKPKVRFNTVKMKPLPPLITNPLETENPLVHKDFAIKFDANSYTVPPWTISKKLTAKADQHTLWIYHREKLIGSYPRCWERKKRIENQAHVEQAKKLMRRQWEVKELKLFASLGEEFREFLGGLSQSDQPIKKQVVALLNLKDQYGIQSLSWAILKALKHGAFGADYIENILYQEMTPTSEHDPVHLKNDALNRIRLSEPSLHDYDAIALKRGRKR